MSAHSADADQALIGERESTIALIASLSARLDAVVEAARDPAADDEQDPEGTTLAVERGQLVAQLERSRVRLAELDEAWNRLVAGRW